jgi:hypothetical protein
MEVGSLLDPVKEAAIREEVPLHAGSVMVL